MKLNYILKLEEITYCKAEGNYTKIVLTDKNELLVKKRIKKIEKDLTKGNFFRCHHSYIVNIDQIKQISSSNLILTKHTIPISRRKKAEFKKFVKEKNNVFL